MSVSSDIFLFWDDNNTKENAMDPFTGLGCLIIYVVYSLFKGRPNYVDSESARNFRKLRNNALKDVSGLKEVKEIKKRCFK